MNARKVEALNTYAKVMAADRMATAAWLVAHDSDEVFVGEAENAILGLHNWGVNLWTELNHEHGVAEEILDAIRDGRACNMCMDCGEAAYVSAQTGRREGHAPDCRWAK